MSADTFQPPTGWRWSAALGAVLACAGCAGPDGTTVAATVNGERITHADLHRYIGSKDIARDRVPDLDADQEQLHRLNALRELIDQRLLLQAAAAEGVSVPDAAVEEVVARHSLPYESEDDFSSYLARYSLTQRDLRIEVRRQLTVERLLLREIASRVQVTDGEVRAYYDRNEAAFTVPEERLHLMQIVVGESHVSPIPNLRNDDASEPEMARRKIERIKDDLDAGQDFQRLAMEYSEDPVYAATGGDMGYMPLSAFEQADLRLRRALVDLEPGDVTDIIALDGEYRILRLIDVEPVGQRAFDDPGVQGAIREVLAGRKEQVMRTAFYTVRRNAADIRNHYAKSIAEEHGLD